MGRCAKSSDSLTRRNRTPELEELLHRLSQHPNLDVTILSGRSQENLEAFLGAYPFRLIAEHGATWRPPGQKEWDRLDKNLNYAWKEELMPILRIYEQATPGSSIEEKHSSIVWHYRKADERVRFLESEPANGRALRINRQSSDQGTSRQEDG